MGNGIGVAVIPAKGNSKVLPQKNLQYVGGRTLLNRTIDQAKRAESIDQIFVVTESSQIAEIAETAGASVIPCTDEMSSNETMVWEKVRIVAETFKECRGGLEPFFVELHPTYPFRTPQLIDEAFKKMQVVGFDADGVIVASPLYDRVWRCSYNRLAPDIEIKARQSQTPLYVDHYGLCNVTRHATALKGNPYKGNLALHIICNKRQTLDIDSAEDLEMCQSLAKNLTVKTFNSMGV